MYQCKKSGNPGDAAKAGDRSGVFADHVSTGGRAIPSTGARGWDPQVMMRLITPERMSTYLGACSGDIDDAFTLYRRNIDIASSIQAITAMVEVVSRNAIDRALTGYVAHTGQINDWFNLPVLDAKAQDDIRVARQRVRRSHIRLLGFRRFCATTASPGIKLSPQHPYQYDYVSWTVRSSLFSCGSRFLSAVSSALLFSLVLG